jgi:hypothetical protein
MYIERYNVIIIEMLPKTGSGGFTGAQPWTKSNRCLLPFNEIKINRSLVLVTFTEEDKHFLVSYKNVVYYEAKSNPENFLKATLKNSLGY